MRVTSPSKLPMIIALHLVSLIQKNVPLTFDTKRTNLETKVLEVRHTPKPPKLC